LRVLLVEQNDLAPGTSAPTKLIHGTAFSSRRCGWCARP
jgi:hypothetical protein